MNISKDLNIDGIDPEKEKNKEAFEKKQKRKSNGGSMDFISDQEDKILKKNLGNGVYKNLQETKKLFDKLLSNEDFSSDNDVKEKIKKAQEIIKEIVESTDKKRNKSLLKKLNDIASSLEEIVLNNVGNLEKEKEKTEEAIKEMTKARDEAINKTEEGDKKVTKEKPELKDEIDDLNKEEIEKIEEAFGVGVKEFFEYIVDHYKDPEERVLFLNKVLELKSFSEVEDMKERITKQKEAAEASINNNKVHDSEDYKKIENDKKDNKNKNEGKEKKEDNDIEKVCGVLEKEIEEKIKKLNEVNINNDADILEEKVYKILDRGKIATDNEKWHLESSEGVKKIFGKFLEENSSEKVETLKNKIIDLERRFLEKVSENFIEKLEGVIKRNENELKVAERQNNKKNISEKRKEKFKERIESHKKAIKDFEFKKEFFKGDDKDFVVNLKGVKVKIEKVYKKNNSEATYGAGISQEGYIERGAINIGDQVDVSDKNDNGLITSSIKRIRKVGDGYIFETKTSYYKMTILGGEDVHSDNEKKESEREEKTTADDKESTEGEKKGAEESEKKESSKDKENKENVNKEKEQSGTVDNENEEPAENENENKEKDEEKEINEVCDKMKNEINEQIKSLNRMNGEVDLDGLEEKIYEILDRGKVAISDDAWHLEASRDVKKLYGKFLSEKSTDKIEKLKDRVINLEKQYLDRASDTFVKKLDAIIKKNKNELKNARNRYEKIKNSNRENAKEKLQNTINSAEKVLKKFNFKKEFFVGEEVDYIDDMQGREVRLEKIIVKNGNSTTVGAGEATEGILNQKRISVGNIVTLDSGDRTSSVKRIRKSGNDILFETKTSFYRMTILNTERKNTSDTEKGQEGESDDQNKEEEKTEASDSESEESTEEEINLDDISEDDISSLFEKDFSINNEDLENIEGFNDLSYGQKLFVLRNLNQIKLGRLQEDSKVEHKNDLANTGFLGRIYKGITKAYQVAKIEKAKANEGSLGGMKKYGRELTELVEGVRNMGPEVKEKNGKLEVQFLNLDGLAFDNIAEIDGYNIIANEFINTPEEWKLPSATMSEKRKYNKIKKEYEEARDKAINILAVYDGEKEALTKMNDVENIIKINQFLTTHPDAEKKLEQIKDDSVWLKALNNIVTERGIWSGAGFLTRTVTSSMIGLAALPVAAAAIGGLRARFKAKESLRDSDKMARKGEKNSIESEKKYSEVQKVSEKVEKILQKLDDVSLSDKKREAYQKALAVSVDWIEDKLDKGLINFGKHYDRLTRQYNLIQVLSQGKVAVENYDLDEKYKRNFETAINERDSKDLKIQKDFLNRQMKRGAIMGAGFAVGGWAIRHFGEHLGWWGETDGQPVSGHEAMLNELSEDQKNTLIQWRDDLHNGKEIPDEELFKFKFSGNDRSDAGRFDRMFSSHTLKHTLDKVFDRIPEDQKDILDNGTEEIKTPFGKISRHTLDNVEHNKHVGIDEVEPRTSNLDGIPNETNHTGSISEENLDTSKVTHDIGDKVDADVHTSTKDIPSDSMNADKDSITDTTVKPEVSQIIEKQNDIVSNSNLSEKAKQALSANEELKKSFFDYLGKKDLSNLSDDELKVYNSALADGELTKYDINLLNSDVPNDVKEFALKNGYDYDNLLVEKVNWKEVSAIEKNKILDIIKRNDVAQLKEEVGWLNAEKQSVLQGDNLTKLTKKALLDGKASAETKDVFIHKYIKGAMEINSTNRRELLEKAINKMSVSNIKTGDGDDVQNLIYKGNVVKINSETGEIRVEKGDGLFEAKSVSEQELRQNWEKMTGKGDGASAENFKTENISGDIKTDAGAYNVKFNYDQNTYTVSGEGIEDYSGSIENGTNLETIKQEIIHHENIGADRYDTGMTDNEILKNSGETANAAEEAIKTHIELSETDLENGNSILKDLNYDNLSLNDISELNEGIKNSINLPETTEAFQKEAARLGININNILNGSISEEDFEKLDFYNEYKNSISPETAASIFKISSEKLATNVDLSFEDIMKNYDMVSSIKSDEQKRLLVELATSPNSKIAILNELFSSKSGLFKIDDYNIYNGVEGIDVQVDPANGNLVMEFDIEGSLSSPELTIRKDGTYSYDVFMGNNQDSGDQKISDIRNVFATLFKEYKK